MGFYFNDGGEVNEEHAVAPQEAPVTGLDENLVACLKSATIVALVEDYLRGAMKHQKFSTGEEMITFAKNLCSEALDNGDMSSADAEHVLSWAEQHRMDGANCECAKTKFIAHVLLEECGEVCSECAPAELTEASALKKQLDQKLEDLKCQYGQIVFGYASDFIRLYGKNFDEHFVQKFGL